MSFVVNVYMQIYLNLIATTMRIAFAIGDERCILKLNRFVEHEPRHKIAIANTITTADHSKDDLLTAMFSLTLLEAFLFHFQPYCLFSFPSLLLFFSLFSSLFFLFPMSHAPRTRVHVVKEFCVTCLYMRYIVHIHNENT